MKITDITAILALQEMAKAIGIQFDYTLALKMEEDMLSKAKPDPETGLILCGCGGKPVVDRVDEWHWEWQAWCPECHIETGFYGTEPEARHAWNRARGYDED